MNVSDEVVDTASKVFCHTYYRPNSVNDGLRAALEAVLPMLNKPEPVVALAVTDEIVERAAHAQYEWAKQSFGYVFPWDGIGDTRQISTRGEARAALESAMPKTDEERLRAAHALCKACLPGEPEILRAKELIEDVMTYRKPSLPRKMMPL